MTVDSHAPLMVLRLTDQETDIDLAALQGLWSEKQYLKLSDQTSRLLEFTDGYVEVVPMPTREHQQILGFLYRNLFALVQVLGGIVLFAPLRVQIRPGKFREPDLLVLVNEQDPRNQNEFWLGADLVIEIVSPDKPKRDTEEKPRDYAEAGIAEYWIVHPFDETITVLTLEGDAYVEHGVFHRGETATSLLLHSFAVEVGAVFGAR